MTWETLAPWIAIAFTLALSILVPLFTQIANNSHQRKMQREKIEYEQSQEKRKAYEQFLLNVGAIVVTGNYSNNEEFTKAGSSLQKLYIYSPSSWWDDLDLLSESIKKFEWDNARFLTQKLSRLIAEDLGEEASKNVKS